MRVQIYISQFQQLYIFSHLPLVKRTLVRLVLFVNQSKSAVRVWGQFLITTQNVGLSVTKKKIDNSTFISNNLKT